MSAGHAVYPVWWLISHQENYNSLYVKRTEFNPVKLLFIYYIDLARDDDHLACV